MYCTRMRRQWEHFQEEVDDVFSLAVSSLATHVVRAVGPTTPCDWGQDMSRQQKAEEQDRGADLWTLRRWVADGYSPSRKEVAGRSPVLKKCWANRSLVCWERESLWYRWEHQGQGRLL